MQPGLCSIGKLITPRSTGMNLNVSLLQEPGVKIFVMNVEAFSSAKGKSVGAWLAKRFGSSGMILHR